MLSVLSGLLGGIIAVILTTYVAKRVGRSGIAGQLRFGPFMWLLAFGCLLFALFPILLTVFFGHHKELLAKFALGISFGLCAIYCFGEAAFVRGRFNEEGIVFSTPWSGTKKERWSDLKSVELNHSLGWYTLTFASGSKIRLSRYLHGHLAALDLGQSHGLQLDIKP